MTVILAATFGVSVAAVIVTFDHVYRQIRVTRRRLHVANVRADRYLEDLCWTHVRDDAYRAAITITLARHGAVSAADLVPILERARELDDAPRLEVVR